MSSAGVDNGAASQSARNLFSATRWRPVVDSISVLLSFAIGLTLPLICMKSAFGAVEGGIGVRMVPCDILVLLTLLVFLVAKTLRIRLSWLFYLLAIVFSMLVATVRHAYTQDALQLCALECVALVVAGLYWVVGYNAGRSTRCFRFMLLGLVLSMFVEFVVVFHDYVFANSKWFIDRHLFRVRGTFRRNGQLGCYAFAMFGLTATFSGYYLRKKYINILFVAGALSSVFMVFASSRRTALLAVLIWALCLVVFAIAKNPKYRLHIGCAVLAIVISMAALLSCGSDRAFFAMRRFDHFTRLLANPDSFPFMQFKVAVASFGDWFPLGLGVGAGRLLNKGTEFHNAYIALSYELGIFGVIAFFALLLDSLSLWTNYCKVKKRQISYVIYACFLASVMFFMVHNRAHRDRSMMLFVGLFSGVGSLALSKKNKAGGG